jgi:hypothetical protein
MIKDCKYCGRKFSGNGKQKYCPGGRCKKNYENSLRRDPQLKDKQGPVWDPSETIFRPARLNDVAAAFWDKLSPTLISKGLLNVLSEDTFAELCDLYSRLIDINRAIDKARLPAPGKTEQFENMGQVSAKVENIGDFAAKLTARTAPVLLEAWKNSQDRLRQETSEKNISAMQAAQRAYEETASEVSAGKDGAGLYECAAGGGIRESALSDLKRKYSKQFLEYCKEFNLTPRGNPANFKSGDSNGKEEPIDRIFD